MALGDGEELAAQYGTLRLATGNKHAVDLEMETSRLRVERIWKLKRLRGAVDLHPGTTP